MMRFLTGTTVVLTAFFVLGCSGGPAINEVEGVVTSNGKPLEKIQVNFYPNIDGPSSSALTDSSGKFVLKTTDSRSGAVVASHKVTLLVRSTGSRANCSYSSSSSGSKATSVSNTTSVPAPMR